METLQYYSTCYNDEERISDYQLVLPKSISSNTREIIPPNNSLLFSLLFRLLMKGKQQGRIGNPLFDQAACLEYHYQFFKGSKKDFFNFTKMMYLSSIESHKLTRLSTIIDKRIMDWFDEKETAFKKVPAFITYLMGTPDWKEISWEYNTGKKYQHKQDLIAVFGNAFNYIEQKFEVYFETHQQIDYVTLREFLYRFRQSFPTNHRVQGVNYFDDLIEQMILKYEGINEHKPNDTTMTTNQKLNKILEQIVKEKTKDNFNQPYVHKYIFEDQLSQAETKQLFQRVLNSGYVRVRGTRYICWSIDTEEFLSSGGFGGEHKKTTNLTESSEEKPNVFLSYCWKDKELAEKIYTELKSTGLNCRKDNHQLEYKDSIGSFMESIRESDYAILLISEDYLKSKNCMIELLHLMKDRNYKAKLLPLLVPNTQIFQSQERLAYSNYWRDEHAKLKAHLKSIDIEDVLEEGKHLKTIRDISQNISEYLNTLGDMLHLNTTTLQESHYKPLIDKIAFYRRN